jgi:hypothetical protein
MEGNAAVMKAAISALNSEDAKAVIECVAKITKLLDECGSNGLIALAFVVAVAQDNPDFCEKEEE